MLTVPFLQVPSHVEFFPEICSIPGPTRRMRRRQHNKIQPTQWNLLPYYKSALVGSVNASAVQLELLNENISHSKLNTASNLLCDV